MIFKRPLREKLLPNECGPTISDHTKQQCRNKRSIITLEARTPLIINTIVNALQ